MIERAPHIPVLLDEVLVALGPVEGATIIDATFGAGGYTRAFLAAGAGRVIGIDRDPTALAAATWASEEPRLALVESPFSALADIAGDARIDAVVMDIGVSSMQLDEAARGFSFMRDGPLDMRMSGTGPTAADIVNKADEAVLADILHFFGEERAARRIARAIVAARAKPIETTERLADIIAATLPTPRPGQIHPATRSFQALRIAVNDELGELIRALTAAERILPQGGRLAVVTFHSLEDRIVKRYLQMAGPQGGGSRHAAPRQTKPARFERPAGSVKPSATEAAANPRARSARLRVGVRTDAPPVALDARKLGMPRAPVVGDLRLDRERRAR